MSRIHQLLRRLWPAGEPTVTESEALTLLSAEALHSISIGLLLWAAIFLAGVQPFFVVRKTVSSFVVVAVILSVSLSLFCLRRHRVRLAGWIFVSAMWSVLTLFTVLSGGIRSPVLGCGLGVIATAAWLLGRKAALHSACLFTVVALGLAVLDQAGLAPPRFLPSPPVVTWALVLGFVIITTLPLNRVLFALRQSLFQAQGRVEDLVRAEQALRSSEDRYRALVDTSPDAITVSDLDGRILMCNRQTAAMHGYARPDELVGKSAFELIVPEEWEKAKDGMLVALRGEAARNLQFTLRRADGSKFPGELSASLIRGARGEAAAFVAVSRDISERKRLEGEVRQVQKMESIGLLAGGVAHDFNNLITVIRCYNQLAAAELSDPAAARESLAEVDKAAQKASVLTGQLLAFSRKQVFRPQVLNLNSVISGMGKMLRPLLGEQIEFVTVLDPALGDTKVDQGQLEQVLMNLAVNARDAMPQGGRLLFETSNVHIGENGARTRLSAGPYVVVAVSDSGVGMDPEMLPRIFEPFFTTKGRGQGTGLGLSVVYGIVKQSGGEICVESDRGRGTTFRIYFPRTGDRCALPNAPGIESESAMGVETILVVDDEAPVLSAVCQSLERHGYSVLRAAAAAEALRICKEFPGVIHLMVTDVVMPGMNGDELAVQAERLRPEMRVLYISGYAESPALVRRLAGNESAFLPKPFTPIELVRRVRLTLDGERAAKL